MLPQPGSMFGRYRIRGKLGRGGMGVVFSAVHTDLDRDVAIKLLSPEYSDDAAYRNRFLREAKTLARLDSPYITQVYDAGEQDGWLFIATELVPDGDLKGYLASHGPMSIRAAADFVRQVAMGLAAAHQNGILHRDVKPSNVLVRPTRAGLQAVVCDLGIAATLGSDLTATAGVVGTLGYMAPERHEGNEATVATDVYSLGCLFWACLTGDGPFRGTDSQVALGHLTAPVPQLPETTPASVTANAILQQTMAKLPEQRFGSATAVARALEAAALSDSDQGLAETILRSTSLMAPRAYVPPNGSHPTSVDVRPAGAITAGRRRGPLWPIIAGVLALAAIATMVVAVVLLGHHGGGSTLASPGSTTTRPSATTTRPISDPIHAGVAIRNLDCGSGWIVVLASGPRNGMGAAGVPVGTAINVLNRVGQAPDRHYLYTAPSCANLGPGSSAGQLEVVPYLGPYSTPRQACEARMQHTDTSTYVLGVAQNDVNPQFCACAYDNASLPALNQAVDNSPPLRNDGFWTQELGWLLVSARYNPTRDVGGKYDANFVSSVQRLQTDHGLPGTGAMDTKTWAVLKGLAC